ncbi:hypothetical protein TSUD_392780 [Trifolium subterraneum]|uniref:RNase H type-1 domain-containing protein n=1 Tax=Trifolium subterraneum TaxID=3900 RepID=A0A2Z6NL91_TRISU|nr:hypothetical protein TSUD_392780 [Trifolium subterraneum]
MGVRHVMGTGTYLGMPSMVGRSKKATFSYIKDRIWRKINSWRSRSLSRAGKEVMIKSVLQAIPSYVMSIYIFPDAIERLTCAKEEGGLGFRDFKSFNMALVAKQGWKIMTNPESLVAKIFKARYFPHSSFLEANLGSNPSYVWRSLWKSCNVLKLGCRWIVGDGRKIKVMKDPWLRDTGSGWMSALQPQTVYKLTVSDLMIEGTKHWDTFRILQLFSFDVADKILAVPLLSEVREDRMVWKEEENGEYTVRSGYKLLMREKEVGRRYGVTGSWKNLWQIRAPPKAKHLLWRICRECLPTRSQLWQHHVQCPINCELCNNADEDAWHALFDCAEVKSSWAVAGLNTVITTRLQSCASVKEVIMDICSNESKEIAGRVAVLIWGIWNNRNQWLWNDERKDVTQLGAQAMHLWNEWYRAQRFNNSTATDEQFQQQNPWSPPRHGWLKCNVDAGTHNAGRIISGGWCIQNDGGQFIRAGTNWVRGAYTILEAEALALLEAMKSVCEMNLQQVIFESDALIVVEAINSSHVALR